MKHKPTMVDASQFAGIHIDENDYNEIMKEHMDYNDMDTLNTICAIQEGDRAALVASLTSRLYDKIVDKVDDIDYGSITKSRGDITKVENYEQLNECISIIHDLVKEYHEDTAPVDEIIDAIANIRSLTREFEKAYQMNLELPIVLYNNMVLACIASVSMMINTSIEYIKDGNGTFKIALDKVAYNKTRDNLLYNDLIKFNRGCKNGQIKSVIEYCIQSNSKQLTGTIGGVIFGIGAGTAIVAGIRYVIPMLRELIYFFFYAKQSVSDYFATQADLLQMNAENLSYRDDLTDDRKNQIISKQNSIANRFRKISNAFTVNVKKNEMNAAKGIDADMKKYKVSDLTDTAFDSDSSLF